METPRSSTAVRLPNGVQFALTWSIPDNFGGMTSALLHRSRAFVRLGGRPVDVLTFDARTDYPDVEARLMGSGELVDGMRLLNLWEWLRAHPVPLDAPGTLDLEAHPFTPMPPQPGALTVTRFAADGTTELQVDYYRRDGSLLATDRRDVDQAGVWGGRSIVLCDEGGMPVRSWGKIWALYRFWLDVLRQRRPSFLLVDSKTVANFAMTYQRKRAVMVHIVHNSHLDSSGIRESRRRVFDDLDAFDAVAVLTPRQRGDIESLLGARQNLAVVPNSRDVSATPPLARPVNRGIVLASLTSRKRVDHAVRAVQAAEGITLDIYGDGDQRDAVTAIADERVRLHGHDPAARAQLARASFLLLTASSEGFPLVLVESMAAGCIPIAYDVPYGPADIIVDGRNGFLVEPGNVAALTTAIETLQAMPAWRVTRMRRAARRAASAYSDLAVTRTWARELRGAATRKAAAWAASHSQVG